MAVHDQLPDNQSQPQSFHQPQKLQSRAPLAISLRKATVSDAPSIAHIGAHTFTSTFGHSVPPHELQAYLDESYSLDATVKDITDPNKVMIVAATTTAASASASIADEETVVGFALLTRGTTEPCLSYLDAKKTVELQRLYVHPSYQHHGVGKLLARELESLGRQQQYEYMWLGVWEENLKAQRVYERMGYGRVGEHDFVIGGEVQTDWIMVKEL